MAATAGMRRTLMLLGCTVPAKRYLAAGSSRFFSKGSDYDRPEMPCITCGGKRSSPASLEAHYKNLHFAIYDKAFPAATKKKVPAHFCTGCVNLFKHPTEKIDHLGLDGECPIKSVERFQQWKKRTNASPDYGVSRFMSYD